MLNPVKKFKNIALVGSTSNLGIGIINQLQFLDESTIHLIGLRNPDLNEFKNLNVTIKFHQCDLSKINEVMDFANQIQKFSNLDLVILAAGVLPKENSEFDLKSLSETILVNTYSSIIFASSFVEYMNSESGGQILICSSVASIRPRIRNFSYGATKSALDFFAVGLQNKFKGSKVKISILRPGYIHTKMTRNFNPAPFSTSLENASKMAAKGLNRKKRVIYIPGKLKLIMNIVSFFPRFIFNRIG